MSIPEGRVAAIRPMQSADLARAAAIHKRCLQTGFFVELGERFLAKYYETFLSSPHAIALSAVMGDEIVGVLVGTRNSAAHYQWVMKNRRSKLALVGLVQMLKHPQLAWRFTKTRLIHYVRGVVKLSRGTTTNNSGDSTPTGTLTHIAVVDSARGSGIGRRLVSTYVDDARSSKVAEQLILVTRNDEVGACAFYEKLGWEKYGSTTHLDGIDFCRLRLKF